LPVFPLVVTNEEGCIGFPSQRFFNGGCAVPRWSAWHSFTSLLSHWPDRTPFLQHGRTVLIAAISLILPMYTNFVTKIWRCHFDVGTKLPTPLYCSKYSVRPGPFGFLAVYIFALFLALPAFCASAPLSNVLMWHQWSPLSPIAPHVGFFFHRSVHFYRLPCPADPIL